MGLAPAWVIRVEVPIGATSRRRPLAAVRAVQAVLRAHPRAGALGSYTDVSHLSISLEQFRGRASTKKARVPVVTVTTYLCGATRDEVEELARGIAAAHPWEHPVIECSGPDGTFVWMPDP